MEITDLSWCDKHSQFMTDHTVSTKDVIELLLRAVAAQGAAARGYSTAEDRGLAAQAIARSAGAQPYCCKLGDKKLHAIVTKVLAEQSTS